MPRDIEFNLVGARHGQKVSDPLRQERRDLACALDGLCDLERAPPPQAIEWGLQPVTRPRGIAKGPRGAREQIVLPKPWQILDSDRLAVFRARPEVGTQQVADRRMVAGADVLADLLQQGQRQDAAAQQPAPGKSGGGGLPQSLQVIVVEWVVIRLIFWGGS